MAWKLFLTGGLVFFTGFAFAIISPKETPIAYRDIIGFMLLGGIAIVAASLLVAIWE